MSDRDIATQIKATFKFRQDIIKNKKRLKLLVSLCVVLVVGIGAISYYSKDIVIEYNKKHTQLNIAKNDFEIEREKVAQETEKVLSEAELIAQNNLYLVEENIKLQKSLQLAASVGVKPQNYDEPEEVDSAVDYSNLEYIGEFEGTAYTPSVEECSNNLGYTASGKPIIAGVSIAVDNKYWKLGTKFYIEGLGYVVAMDTGNAVKGKYRFDYAVFDRDYALKLGRRTWKVYLVKEAEEK